MGKNDNFAINTMLPYNVRTEFWVNQSEEFVKTELA